MIRFVHEAANTEKNLTAVCTHWSQQDCLLVSLGPVSVKWWLGLNRHWRKNWEASRVLSTFLQLFSCVSLTNLALYITAKSDETSPQLYICRFTTPVLCLPSDYSEWSVLVPVPALPMVTGSPSLLPSQGFLLKLSLLSSLSHFPS